MESAQRRGKSVSGDGSLVLRAKRINRRLNWAERELAMTRLNSFPPMIQIEPTNRCAMNCPTCARGYYDRDANSPMDFDEAWIERLSPAFETAETVLFGGYGEPLLGKAFNPLLESAKRHLCRTELITSGSALDEPAACFLIQQGHDAIWFSVDAASDELMTKRRGITLTTIEKKIEMLRGLGGREVALGYNLTLSAENLEQLPALAERAGKMGVAEIRVAHQKIYTSDQRDQSVLANSDRAETVFEQARTAAASSGVSLMLPPLSGVHACHQPFELLMISADGRVQGCCSALFIGGQPKLELGRILDDELLDLWNHPLMIQARAAAFGQGDPPEPCSDCAFRIFEERTHLRLIDGKNE
jgi:MoaA/NifB/PqqE/SkfB family radical SAM enzyme